MRRRSGEHWVHLGVFGLLAGLALPLACAGRAELLSSDGGGAGAGGSGPRYPECPGDGNSPCSVDGAGGFGFRDGNGISVDGSRFSVDGSRFSVDGSRFGVDGRGFPDGSIAVDGFEDGFGDGFGDGAPDPSQGGAGGAPF